MSIYRRVSKRIWRDSGFRQLSRAAPNPQSLFLYLLTGSETAKVPGFVHISLPALAFALDWTTDDVVEQLSELSDAGMAFADWDSELVWLPDGVRFCQKPHPNTLRREAEAVWARLGSQPETRFKKAFRNTYRDLLRFEDRATRPENNSKGNS